MTDRARMEISVYPLGTGDASITKHIAKIFDVLESCGMTYQITVMGTIVEGTVHELFALAERLHDTVFADGVDRVVTTIKIDERRQ